ncbi:MAG: filamentous hemagglutinin N-terminal domain-containing protein [Gammaproteobacteria bacterium]|nr:filamentous hemagglutinin N-terminal domain-containing protein [Gammaproteobacteria bacterium]
MASRFGPYRLLVATSVLFSTPCFSAPVGGEITAGTGQIQTLSDTTTLVTQQSNVLSINWQSLNLGTDELLRFEQPSAQSAALNSILDQQPSLIFGKIEANGRVFLMNPNGMIFGESARINVGALGAGAFQMEAGSFNDNGGFSFTTGAGRVENAGQITVPEGGSVALIGQTVSNNGQISARLGKIHLLSADAASLSFDNDGLIQFALSRDTVENALNSESAVHNNGVLQADGGYVVLEAHAARNVYHNVVNNEGLIQASRIRNEGGVIRLEGSGGNVINSGELNATGLDEGQTGGEITMMGDRVGVFGDARIDVSGAEGGGSIAIGGYRKGAGENTAAFTQVGADTDLRADAISRGDGGEIVVWADDTSWAAGTVSATGGALGGDGGFVEISGRQGLVLSAGVDLSAARGSLGTLLLDPTDIIIHDQADGAQGNDGLLPDLSDATQGAGSFDIGELALEALGFNSNLVLEATNNITINDLADNSLDFLINSGGSITMTADAGVPDGVGSLTMNTGDAITTQGSALTLSGAGITLGSLSTGDGAITINSTRSVDMGAATSATNTINVTVDSDNNGAETLTLRGALSGSTVNLLGGSNGGDTLIAPDSINAWTVSALNAGTLNGAAFSQFPNLTGGSLDDTFALSGTGSIAGVFDGAGHSVGDTVDYSGRPGGIFSVTLDGNVQNIENLIGNGNDNSTLIAADVANTWMITAENDGTVAGVAFTNFKNITGGSDTDDFILSGGSVTGTVDGGGGINSLTANDTDNDWNILSADGGNIVASVFAFTNIANLIGGGLVDSFLINAGSISGTIDGGAGSDALSAANVANVWTITNNDAGTVTNVNAFQSIENLIGRTSTDDFTLAVGVTMSGTIDGGGGDDSIDLSAQIGTVVDLAGSSYANIEQYTGNATDSTLIGADTPNVWTINGSLDGIDDGTVGLISFTNFNNLTGGTDTDTFTLSGGTLSGTLDGGGGTDTLVGDNLPNTWNISSADAGTATGIGGGFSSIENLTGNANTDDFIFADGSSLSGVINGATGSDRVDFSAESAAVVVTMGAAGFANIESFEGNNTDSTIIGDNVANDWVINGDNDGTVSYFTGSTAFSNFTNLTGGSDTDSFRLSGGSIIVQIDGGGGVNTLIGYNQVNDWAISGANAGTVTGVVGFSNIENLTGGSDTDNFVFADPGSISGVINGAAGTDEVSYAAKTAAVVVDIADSNFLSIESFIGNDTDSTLLGDNTLNAWSITGANSGTVGIVSFAGFNHLTGNDAADTFQFSVGGSLAGSITGTGSITGGLGNDTLQGKDTDNSWAITGADTGTLNSVVAFSELESLLGGNAVDTFTFADGSSFGGVINGGAGSDVVNQAAITTPVNINLASASFASIESFIGNGTNSSLSGPAVNSTWLVTAIDSGTVNGINFSGFNNITGNTQTDTFQITSGEITGIISGGLGIDTLTARDVANTWNISGTDTGNVTDVASFSQIENLTGGSTTDTFVFGAVGDVSGNINGGAGADTVDLANKSGAVAIDLASSRFTNIETFIGNNINSTLTGPASLNTWQITGNNDGSVGGIAFNNFNNLVGNINVDVFLFQNGGAITGIVDGGSGQDTVDFTLESGVVDVVLGSTNYARIETFVGNNVSSTLTGDALANTWVITDVNEGTLGTISFSDFNNLVGNSGSDHFTLNGGSITGTVDGAAGANTITADNTANSWTITAADAGSVTGISAFSNIENLNGNAGTDGFTFADGGSISGVVNGAGGVDVVDQSAQSGFVNLLLGSSGYTNIESFIGNGGNSTLTGDNTINTWTLTGPDTGTVGSVNFANISNLQGGSNDDSFTTNGGTVTGQINGGSGNDLILAENVINTWNITGANTGNVNGINSFTDIENLLGNASVDNYIFADGSSFSGVIDGAGGSDVVDHSSETNAVIVSLASGQYQNIELFVGNTTNSTLVGDNTTNAWSITGGNAGAVNSINFTGYNNVTGNASADTFTLAGGNITGTIDGGSGNDSIQAENITNTWNVTAQDAGNLTQVNAFQNIDNLLGGSAVDTFNLDANLSGMVSGGGGDDLVNLGGLVTIGGGLIGGTSTDTLTGPDQNSSWIIAGLDSGFVNGTAFSQIESLNGGIGNDSFNISNAAAAGISGGIAGGAGDDNLAVDYVAASSRNITFDGGTGTDSISLTGTASGLINTFTFGPASDAVMITSNSGSINQTVTGSGVEAANDSMTADTINLLGSTGDDVMQLSPGSIGGSQPVSFQISGMPALQFSNKTDLAINAGAGSDSVTITGAVTLAGDITLAAESVVQGAGGQLGADTLTLADVASIGSSSNPLATSVNTLDITGATVDAYVLESNGLAASAENVSGVLSITTNAGNITSSGRFNVTGTSAFAVADGGSIILDDAANLFSGTPGFSSSGTIHHLLLTDNSAVDIPSLTLTGDLEILATGMVTQAGALNIQGNTIIDANTSTITLTDAGNDFAGSVSLRNSGQANTAITDANSLQLAASSVGSGTLNISAGAISQSGSLVQAAGAGTATFTADSGDIALTNGGNEFTGAVVINNTGPGDSALTDSSGLTLAASTTSGGDLTIIANDTINLSGTTTSNNGDISITANTGDIQLGLLNAGSGRLTINAASGNVIGDTSTITNPNLSSQTLEIFAGETIGSFNNPISVNVASGGTSLFIAGEGSANIIGLPGTILPGSVLVNDVTTTNIAVGKGQSVSFIENTIRPTQAFLSPLYDISSGGLHLYDYEYNREPDEKAKRRTDRRK